MNKEHLHLLINEEIYLIPSKENEDVDNSAQEALQSAPVAENESKEEETTIHIEQEELVHDHHDETPHIPKVKTLEEKEALIPFAVFHESSVPEEIELLEKIIGACNIGSDKYQVFANGFNKEVKFEKALVFVSQAKAFYEPIPYQNSQFLCSKPLSELNTNKQEKAKLWNSLKDFLK